MECDPELLAPNGRTVASTSGTYLTSAYWQRSKLGRASLLLELQSLGIANPILKETVAREKVRSNVSY